MQQKEANQVMEINVDLPKFDLPKDFIVGEGVTGDILNMYGLFPCKIKAGVFAFCTRGTVRVTINLNECVIRANDFITLFPNTFIQIHEVSEDVEVCFAAFSSRFLERLNFIRTVSDLIFTVIENPVVQLPEQASIVYRDFFSLLVRAENEPESILFADSLKPILDLFLQGVTNMYKRFHDWKKPELSREKEIARDFIQLVWQYYTRERSASFYANKLRITLPHFCYVIKKTTGMTALDIIANVVIMDAKAQLKSTNLPIKEISMGLGYNNVAFFDKYFRRHVGMSPLEYRNS